MNFMIFACLQFAVWTFSAIDNKVFLSLDTVVFITKDGGTSLLKQLYLDEFVKKALIYFLKTDSFFDFARD